MSFLIILIYQQCNFQVIVITLNPGEALKLHNTPVDVFFCVLEGTGTIGIGGEKESAGKDSLVQSPANIPHRRINESNAVFRVLVGKVPLPVSETKIL